MGQVLRVDDDDVASMLQTEIVQVQAAAHAALAAIRQARAGRDKDAVVKLRAELRQWRGRITQLVDAIYRA
jgi:hypothetical protein